MGKFKTNITLLFENRNLIILFINVIVVSNKITNACKSV